MKIAQGTVLLVVQKEDLATHLLPDPTLSTKALCGVYTGHRPSYSLSAVVRQGGRLEYTHDGFGCLHHVDCKRCHAIYTKAVKS